jgi:Fic family protein
MASNSTPFPRETRSGVFTLEGDGPESYAVFHPKPLPPEPPLLIDPPLQALLDQANQSLGRLDGITILLPDPDTFLYTYIRKEAVLSSQIEGTQSSLSDLLLFEHRAAPGVPIADVQETSNYIAAMNHGIAAMRNGRPLSLSLIKEVHERLLLGVRGGSTSVGEFRRIQNWLGGTRPANARFVPPPPQDVLPAVSLLEKFLHDDPVPTPILVKAALAHAQFETIHPFLDGNGRVGRLLVTLLLCAKPDPPDRPVLGRPLLYLSLYLKRHREAYYDYLQRVRTEGAWEEWLRFFLEGVVDVAGSATDTTRQIVQMLSADRQRIQTLGRPSGSVLQVHDVLSREVVTSVSDSARLLPLSAPTVATALRHLEELGIVREMTGRSRNRLWAYTQYLLILNEGTEPVGAYGPPTDEGATQFDLEADRSPAGT